MLITQAMPGRPANGRTPSTYSSQPRAPITPSAASSANSCAPEPGTASPKVVELSGLPSTRNSALMPMNAPAETNSPCEKFSVLVVVNVMLKPSATSAYAPPTARPLISACRSASTIV